MPENIRNHLILLSSNGEKWVCTDKFTTGEEKTMLGTIVTYKKGKLYQ